MIAGLDVQTFLPEESSDENSGQEMKSSPTVKRTDNIHSNLFHAFQLMSLVYANSKSINLIPMNGAIKPPRP